MSTEYFEDINLHQIDRSREYQLNELEIIDFAKQWDPQPFHIDSESAKNTKFKGLAASGIHLVAICGKLMSEYESKPAFVAGMGFDKFRFKNPARPGDVLAMEIEAISKRESQSDPNTGVVCISFRLLNQLNHPVLTGEVVGLVGKRNRL